MIDYIVGALCILMGFGSMYFYIRGLKEYRNIVNFLKSVDSTGIRHNQRQGLWVGELQSGMANAIRLRVLPIGIFTAISLTIAVSVFFNKSPIGEYTGAHILSDMFKAITLTSYATKLNENNKRLENNPDDIEAQINMSMIYRRLGEEEKADYHRDKLLQTPMIDHPAMSKMLITELAYGDPKKATFYYNDLANTMAHRDDPYFRLFRPISQFIAGDLVRAEKEFNKALEQNNEMSKRTKAKISLEYANFQVINGKFVQAGILIDDVMQTAIEENDSLLQGYAVSQMAILKREFGNTSEYGEYMFRLLKYYSNSTIKTVAAWMAFQDAIEGRHWLAQKFLEILFQIGDIEDRKKQAFRLLVEGALKQSDGKAKEAVIMYQDALKQYPDLFLPRAPFFLQPIMGYEALALAYEQDGQVDLAMKVWTDILNRKLPALSTPTGSPFCWVKAYYHLGRLFEKKNEIQAAILSYEKFIDLWGNADMVHPDIQKARSRLASLQS